APSGGVTPSVHHLSAISERPSYDSSFGSRSCKRSRSHVASVPLSSPTLGALFYARADLLPSPKRIRSPETATDLEDFSEDRFEPYVPREVGLGVDFEDESSEPSRSRGDDLVMDVDVVRSDGIEINPKIHELVVVEAVDRKESETGMRGPVKVRVERVTHPRFHDHTEAIPVHRIQAIKEVQREQGRRIIRAESAVTVLTERVAELERDNRRLRDTASVESQRVDRLQHASMTHEEVEELVNHRVAEEMEACEAAMNLEPTNENGDEQEGGNGGNEGNGNRGNGGNGNGNKGNEENGNGGNGHRNGNHGMNYGGFMPVAR
ncbi:hypothetical protein Tco_1529764, partial [Tanacetum coccineum]